MFIWTRVISAVFLAVLTFKIFSVSLPFPLNFLSGGAGAFLGFFLPPKISLFWEKFVTRLTKKVALEVTRQLKTRFPAKRKGSAVFILDTSSLIDGRIGDIIKCGFLPGEILIPDFVLQELQMIADSPDSLRRAKGRRGLTILGEIKENRGLEILRTKIRGGKTDEKLVKLAQKKKAGLVTVDFNLNKVAQVSGVAVLNVNKLAQAVRALVLPGEELEINIVAPGRGKDQGVGYLEDGTMVVVEEGGGLVGKKVRVEVSRFLQTEAGRMIFARVK